MHSKLTKKNIYLILSEIIGDDYNESMDIKNENFIGFFKWNDDIDDDKKLTKNQKCLIAIDYFKNYFKDYFESTIIATSLIIDNQLLKKNQLEYLLSFKAFILPLNYNFIFSDDQDNYKEGIDYDDISHTYNEIISSFRLFLNIIMMT